MPDLRALQMTTDLFDYIVSHSSTDPIYRQIQEDTLRSAGSQAGMQIGEDQFALLTLLTDFANDVPGVPGGKLLCCDISEEWTTVARRHWEDAGLSDRIELRLAPAMETISTLPAQPPADLVFLDADKGGYVDYYEALIPKLRSGGLFIADNTLWSGNVVDPSISDQNIEGIRRFNDRVAGDARCDVVMLAIGDGVTLCLKR